MKYCEGDRAPDCPNEAVVDVWGVNKAGVFAIKAVCAEHKQTFLPSRVFVDRRTGLIL